jgi:hypothetical protein
MRQAVLFSNYKHLKISGISHDFWRHSNWSVMALLKFRNIGQNHVRVLGHGSTSPNKGLHLGIDGRKKVTFILDLFNDLNRDENGSLHELVQF